MHLSVRDMDTLRCRDMALRSRKEFSRSTRTKCTYHAEQREAISRLRSKHITRGEVALYHDGNAVYITPPQVDQKGVFMAKTSHELAIEFAVEITELCSKIKGRPEYTKQLIRSASSIGANIAEAKYAESNADFVHKLEIAQKEANEAETWLSVLCKSGIIDELTFKSLRNKCGKIRRMLIASITTVKSKINGQK